MNTIGSESIKELLSTAGPCVTIVSPEQDLDATVDSVRKVLALRKIDPKIMPAAITLDNKGLNAIAILCAPGFERILAVDPSVTSIAKVADQFDLRTLLAIAGTTASYHVLALSQKRTRILECTQTSSREVPFPAGFAANLADSKQTDQPDHDLENRSSAGPSIGSMKGVMFGSSTDREKKDEYLLHFFSGIDKAVNMALKGSASPLIVVAVEHEFALYKQINTYPHLMESVVHGSPDGMEGGELHQRTLALLQSEPPQATAETLADFDKKVGTGHASVHIQEIVTAAFEGRVSHLFFQQSAKYEGTFDAMRQKVKHSNANGDGAVDLVEAAAFETLRHGGEATVLPGSAMPNGAAVCALFRYAAARTMGATEAA